LESTLGCGIITGREVLHGPVQDFHRRLGGQEKEAAEKKAGYPA